MLTKCVTTKSTLLVPDMEDSVPVPEKPKARQMIRDKLAYLRANAALGASTVITPRTNSLDTGLFFDDVRGILDAESAKLIDGFCIPKVDRVSDVNEIDAFLASEEKRLSLAENSLKVIP